jgi:hypothetical protein
MPKTYYASNTTLNSFLRNTPYTPVVVTYLALFTATPGPTGGGTEVSGNGYARQTIAFGPPTNGSCSNTVTISFPVDVVADWMTVTSFGVFDAASGGNLLYYANLSSSRYVAVNDQVVFNAGSLVATET